jgi:hypothetical protein
MIINVLVLMYDKVLVLHEIMVRYWYCANIPPRPLDEKYVKNLEVGVKKTRKEFGTNQRLRKKSCF